jgi:hypothetical protein
MDLGNRWLVRLVRVLGYFFIFTAYSGAIPLNAAQQAYYRRLGVVDYLSSMAVGLITAVAVVQLVRLRKSAVVAFGATLALNAALWLVQFLRGGITQALGGSGLVGALLGLVLLSAVFLYARRLREKGVLT